MCVEVDAILWQNGLVDAVGMLVEVNELWMLMRRVVNLWKKADLCVAMQIDRHADSTLVTVKFRGMDTMLFMNMSRHVSTMTHTYHKVMIHCMMQYLHNQYES